MACRDSSGRFTSCGLSGTKRGGRRKTARRAYMSGLSGTKRGGRRKTARRAYEGLGRTKREDEYLWASGVAGLDGTKRHCTKFRKKPRKVCVKYAPGPGRNPAPGSKGVRHCTRKVEKKVNTCVEYKKGAGKPRGYPGKRKAASKKRGTTRHKRADYMTAAGNCKFGRVKSGARKGKCRYYKARTAKKGSWGAPAKKTSGKSTRSVRARY